MGNIHSYLEWRGDLSVVERPFNDADNVILATLSYLDFTGIIPPEQGRGITLTDACRQLLVRCEGDVTPYVRSLAKVDTRFVELMAASKRFGPCILRNYADMVDDARALQFSALQVDLPDNETYVAFRGTDGTLVGWREDFMLSFTVTEAQREAHSYLTQALSYAREQGRTVRVGGHSKGGVLAEYASACLPDQDLERVIRVYSNDGPGMAPEQGGREARQRLEGKFRRIIPTYSIVGMLYSRPGDSCHIVESTGAGIGQHDPTTWQVTSSGIVEANELTPDCEVLNRAIADWARDIPFEERKRVTNEVFDALAAGGAERFDQIAASPESVQKVLHAFEATDERTLNLAKMLVENAVASSVEAVRKASREALEGWRRDMTAMTQAPTKPLFGSKAAGGIVVIPSKLLNVRPPQRKR